MAEFNNVVLTRRGIDLMTKSLAGECQTEFTKVQAGNGVWAASELQNATALRAMKQEFGVSRVKKMNEATVALLGVLSNQNLNAGYWIREYGVFAREKGKANTEVLYAIITADENKADYMPPYNSVSPQIIEIEAYISVANADRVTIQIGTGALASADDLNKLINDVGSLKDLNTTDKSTIVRAINEVNTREKNDNASVVSSVKTLEKKHTDELNAAKQQHTTDINAIKAQHAADVEAIYKQINGLHVFVNGRRRLCVTQNINVTD